MWPSGFPGASTPKLPSKTPKIPSPKGKKALHVAALKAEKPLQYLGPSIPLLAVSISILGR